MRHNLVISGRIKRQALFIGADSRPILDKNARPFQAEGGNISALNAQERHIEAQLAARTPTR